MGYEDEEQSIIDDESLSPEERKKALKSLYREAIEIEREYPNESS